MCPSLRGTPPFHPNLSFSCRNLAAVSSATSRPYASCTPGTTWTLPKPARQKSEQTSRHSDAAHSFSTFPPRRNRTWKGGRKGSGARTAAAFQLEKTWKGRRDSNAAREVGEFEKRSDEGCHSGASMG